MKTILVLVAVSLFVACNPVWKHEKFKNKSVQPVGENIVFLTNLNEKMGHEDVLISLKNFNKDIDLVCEINMYADKGEIISQLPALLVKGDQHLHYNIFLNAENTKTIKSKCKKFEIDIDILDSFKTAIALNDLIMADELYNQYKSKDIFSVIVLEALIPLISLFDVEDLKLRYGLEHLESASEQYRLQLFAEEGIEKCSVRKSIICDQLLGGAKDISNSTVRTCEVEFNEKGHFELCGSDATWEDILKESYDE